MHPRRTMLWEFPKLSALEISRFFEGPGVNKFDGIVLTILDSVPAEIRYSVTCDSSWRTREAVVNLQSVSRTERWHITVDDHGIWTCNNVVIDEFRGLVDIDLGFSPCTNTLPIRRLHLAEGESSAFTAAWLRFPELRFERLDQQYTRLEGQRYRYESGGGRFTAELEVDDLGLVTTYGNLWRRRSTG